MTTRRKHIIDDLAKLDGKPPHNKPGNFCYMDGYFAASLKEKYGKSIPELRKEVRL